MADFEMVDTVDSQTDIYVCIYAVTAFFSVRLIVSTAFSMSKNYKLRSKLYAIILELIMYCIL